MYIESFATDCLPARLPLPAKTRSTRRQPAPATRVSDPCGYGYGSTSRHPGVDPCNSLRFFYVSALLSRDSSCHSFMLFMAGAEACYGAWLVIEGSLRSFRVIHSCREDVGVMGAAWRVQ